MYKLLLAAGVASLAFATPASADPGKGKGHDGAKHGQVAKAHGNQGKHARMVHQGHVGANFWGNGCPPGLAKKNNGCLPPGQAKKLYSRGQRWPGNYGYAWSYNQIPYDLRSRYGFDPDDRYYYGDGYIYRVDPATMLISQVVSAILR
jgi:hypothetical protein